MYTFGHGGAAVRPVHSAGHQKRRITLKKVIVRKVCIAVAAVVSIVPLAQATEKTAVAAKRTVLTIQVPEPSALSLLAVDLGVVGAAVVLFWRRRVGKAQ